MLPKEESALLLIQEDKVYEDYFFKEVSEVKWFFPLKELGYFSPEKNPRPEPVEKGGVKIFQWNVLDYLEKISLQIKEPPNDVYINELLNIIKDVSLYRDINGKIIDNYRTWWYFIKILLNIPNNRIPLEIMESIPLWLHSKYGTSLVDADLATKLLPKLFNKDSSLEDLKKGELVIDYLTEIKWVNKKGVFKDVEEDPTGIADNYWLEKAFFNKGIAKLIGEIGSEEIIYKLANKLKVIFRKHHKTNWIDFDENNKTYRFSIDQEQDYRFRCRVGFYERKEKEREGESALLESLKINPKILFEFEINAQNLSDFAQKLKAQLKTKEISNDFKNEINKKSKDLYKNVLEDYSYIWLKDLSSEANLYEIQHILLAILATALLKRAEIKIDSTKKIIEKFLSAEYQNPAFTRLVLFTTSKYWNTFKDIFWNALLKKADEPIFEIPDFEYELRILFKENGVKLTKEESGEIKSLIEGGPRKYLPDDNKDKYIIYWKQRWYGALKENPYFLDFYKQMKNLTSFEDEEQEAKDSGGVWIGPGDSPITEDEILKMRNIDIAESLSKFKGKDIWDRKGPSTEGLANSLENAVKNKPNKFTEDLGPFINTGFYYVYHIFSGFKKAWNNKTLLDWSKIIYFAEKYIDRTEFWNNKLKVPSGFYNADNRWITGIIGELIQEGVSNDDWSIPSDNFPIIKKIFSLIGNNAAKDEKDANDFPTHVINCGLGKTLMGLTYFILRAVRLEKKVNEPKWSNDLKELYEIYLDRNIYDSYTVLGEYLINFAYIDKAWTQEQINKINKKEDKILWEAFMSGYLAASRVNLDLYALMKDFYLKGLSYDFKEKQLSQRLIDHIGIAYLNEVEKLEGTGLLGVLWKKQNATQIQELIFYLWTQRENLKDTELDIQMKSRIIDFWREIYQEYKDKETLTRNDKEVLSDIIKLIVYLPEISDENFQWLFLSAPYVEEHYNSAYLLEYLNILKNKGDKKVTALKIAKIFLRVLEFSKPYYDEEDIRSIVEFLYQVNDPEVKKLANNICDKYANDQIEIVTSLYNKYN